MNSAPEQGKSSRRSRWAAAGDGLRKAPLLFAAFAGVAGIVLADRGQLPALLLAMLASLGIAGLVRPRSRGTATVLAGGALALGLLGWRQHERLAEIRAFPLASVLAAGQSVEVEGEGWIADTADYGPRSVSTAVQIESLSLGGRRLSCEHRVPCWIQKRPLGLGYGTPIRFTGRLVPLEGASVPGGFDAGAFYFRQWGALAKLEIREGDHLELRPGHAGSTIVRRALELRVRLEAALLLGVPPALEPYSRLVAAMALGARENSPEELEEAFRRSGTLHLFAVSGLNVAIVAAMLIRLAAFFGIPRAWAAPVAIPLVLFYSAITGLSPSAVRAALMASAFLAGYALREKPRLLNSLGFAALLLFAYDPQQLFQPGFQLSFAVLLFIGLLARPIGEAFAKPFLADPFLPQSLIRPARRFADRCAGWTAAVVAVSVASWLGSLGLLAWHFKNISVVGLIANVFMVPTASIIMGLAAASLAAYGLRLTWIVLLANGLNALVSFCLAAMAQFFAGLPGAAMHTGTASRPSPETLRLDVVGDRGEGAALLEIPSGHDRQPLLWMIDCGGPRTYQGRVLPLLRHRGVNRIDALVLTHGDHGHIGAAPALLGHFRPPLVLESSVENRSPSHREIRTAIERLGIERIVLDRGHRLAVGAGATLAVLHPSSGSPGRLADDRALVLKLDYAGRSLLFTSDSGFDTEQDLLESGADLRAEVWIRGQHDSAPSGLPAFVDAVSPRAVVSSHSSFPESERVPEALREHLRRRGIPLFDLESAGTVTIEVDRGGLRIQPFAGSAEALLLPPP